MFVGPICPENVERADGGCYASLKSAVMIQRLLECLSMERASSVELKKRGIFSIVISLSATSFTALCTAAVDTLGV